MKKSTEILKDHPVNIDRIKRGLNPATSVWFWGAGTKPRLSNFYELYGVHGSVISAVDLIKGIALCSGLKSIDVEGATGNIHTNFKGKALAALNELEQGQDFVYVHVEAPDECGHQKQYKEKVRAIELIDNEIIGTILDGLNKYEDYKIIVLPDHPTPLDLMTHTKDPVPFVIYQKSKNLSNGALLYSEEEAKKTGLYIEEGYTLMKHFLA